MLKFFFICSVIYGIILGVKELKNQSGKRIKESRNLYIFWDIFK